MGKKAKQPGKVAGLVAKPDGKATEKAELPDAESAVSDLSTLEGVAILTQKEGKAARDGKELAAAKSKEGKELTKGKDAKAQVTKEKDGKKSKDNANGKVASRKGKEKDREEQAKKEEQAAIEAECKQALLSLRRGNPQKAVKLIAEVNKRHKDHAMGHRICAYIQYKLAASIEEEKMKKSYLTAAMEAAKTAAMLSPRSIEYRLFYANVMLEHAKTDQEYMEVKDECDRALQVEDPKDPADDHLGDMDAEQAALTPEARIDAAKQELRNLSGKAQMLQMQTWMHEFTKGQQGPEKMRIIQLKSRMNDETSLEQRISQPKRQDQVKKNVKTKDEIRAEIEVRVAAAQLVQQRERDNPEAALKVTGALAANGDSAAELNERRRRDEDDGEGGVGKRDMKDRLKEKLKREERLKREGKGTALDEKVERVKGFWMSCGEEKRKEFLDVSIEELRKYLASAKNSSENVAATDEALDFGKIRQHWIFWECCRCKERFIKRQDYENHMINEHVGTLPHRLQRILPADLPEEWLDFLLEEKAEPVDGPTAVRMLVELCTLDNAQQAATRLLEAPPLDTIEPNVGVEMVATANGNGVAAGSTGAGLKCNSCENGGQKGGELSSPGSAVFDSASEGSDCSALSPVSSIEQFEDPVYTAIEPVDSEPGSPILGMQQKGRAEPGEIERGVMDADGIVHHHTCTGDCQRGETRGRSNLEKDQLPIADDLERRKLLEKIQGLFKALYQNRCLAQDHVLKIIEFSLNEINNMVPEKEPHYEFTPTPLFIRFLKAEHLKAIIKYLMELVHSLGIDRTQIQLDISETLVVLHTVEALPSDRLLLNADYSKLLLDEVVYEEPPPPPRAEGELVPEEELAAPKDKEGPLEPSQELVLVDLESISLISSLRKVGKEEGRSFAEVQLQWIYTQADYEHRPSDFRKMIEERMREAKECLSEMEKHFTELRRLAEKKREFLLLEEGVNKAEVLCNEELRLRQREGCTMRDFDKVLLKRQMELGDDGGRLPSASNLSLQRRLEQEAIAAILRESHNMPAARFMDPAGLASGSLSDLDDEDSALRHIRDLVTLPDSRIEMAIERQRQLYNNEITTLDAKITQTLNEYRCAEISLNNKSIFDYRSILLPLTKSFLQHRLEEAAEKDAVIKSDKAREAFLAELAKSEAGKAKPKGPEPQKHSGKAKDKKKDRKKGKRPPGASVGGAMAAEVEEEEAEAEDEAAEPEEDVMLSVEEQRRKAEEEAVERQLQEAIQRQLEAEATMMERRKREERLTSRRDHPQTPPAQESRRPEHSHSRHHHQNQHHHHYQQQQQGQQQGQQHQHSHGGSANNNSLRPRPVNRDHRESRPSVSGGGGRPGSGGGQRELKNQNHNQQPRAAPLESAQPPASATPVHSPASSGARGPGGQAPMPVPVPVPVPVPQVPVHTVSPPLRHLDVQETPSPLHLLGLGIDREAPERDSRHQQQVLQVGRGAAGRGAGNWGPRQPPPPAAVLPVPLNMVSVETLPGEAMAMVGNYPPHVQQGWELPEAHPGAGVWEVSQLEEAQAAAYMLAPPLGTPQGQEMPIGWHPSSVPPPMRQVLVSPPAHHPSVLAPRPMDGEVDIDSLMRTLLPGGGAPPLEPTQQPRLSGMTPPEMRHSWSPSAPPPNGAMATPPPHLPRPISLPMNGSPTAAAVPLTTVTTVLTPPAPPRPPPNSLAAAASMPGQQKLSWAALAKSGLENSISAGGMPTSARDVKPPAAHQASPPVKDDAAQRGGATVVSPDTDSIDKDVTVDEVAQGLQNEVGQYNCFLNVVIQSLYNLRLFREQLLSASSLKHTHVGEPCVVCALRNIFAALKANGKDKDNGSSVAPTDLRIALRALFADTDLFQESQMNDASEVLAVIFDCLHKAFASPADSSSNGGAPGGAGANGTTGGAAAGDGWECVDDTSHQSGCMAHDLFGLDVAEQMTCEQCGVESRHLKYSTFFHNINASALRTAKETYEGCRLDELLKLVDMNHQLPCDSDRGGCGQPNHTHHFLRAQPHVFTTVLGWQNGRESEEDISATVDSIDTCMDVGIIYSGTNSGAMHQLVSVVCYYGQHYECFAYMHELDRWVMFDDNVVKFIGGWEAVAERCRKGHLQPQVLFYEAMAQPLAVAVQ